MVEAVVRQPMMEVARDWVCFNGGRKAYVAVKATVYVPLSGTARMNLGDCNLGLM